MQEERDRMQEEKVRMQEERDRMQSSIDQLQSDLVRCQHDAKRAACKRCLGSDRFHLVLLYIIFYDFTSLHFFCYLWLFGIGVIGL